MNNIDYMHHTHTYTHTHTHKGGISPGKHSNSPTEASGMITCLARQQPFAVPARLIISPLQEAVSAALPFSPKSPHTSICSDVT